MDLFERIKRDEGFRRHGYRDHLGVLTIGYGRNIDAEAGGPGITESEASILLARDLDGAERDLQLIFPRWAEFNQVRQQALVNMRFQLGPTRFRSFRRMIRAINAGRWVLASQEALDSRWAGQTPGRAYRIARELRTGVVQAA